MVIAGERVDAQTPVSKLRPKNRNKSRRDKLNGELVTILLIP